MGQSKGNGYSKVDTLTPEQKTLLNQMLSQSGQNTQQAAQGYAQFLPGGGGGEAIKNQAYKDFEQRTIPSILNAFSGSKGSSSLNQALASGGSDLNTSLASMLSQYQLNAAQGLGGLGAQQGNAGLQTSGFGYTPKQPPLWQSILKGGAGGAATGSLFGPIGTGIGGALGAGLGAFR